MRGHKISISGKVRRITSVTIAYLELWDVLYKGECERK